MSVPRVFDRPSGEQKIIIYQNENRHTFKRGFVKVTIRFGREAGLMGLIDLHSGSSHGDSNNGTTPSLQRNPSESSEKENRWDFAKNPNPPLESAK